MISLNSYVYFSPELSWYKVAEVTWQTREVASKIWFVSDSPWTVSGGALVDRPQPSPNDQILLHLKPEKLKKNLIKEKA